MRRRGDEARWNAVGRPSARVQSPPTRIARVAPLPERRVRRQREQDGEPRPQGIRRAHSRRLARNAHVHVHAVDVMLVRQVRDACGDVGVALVDVEPRSLRHTERCAAADHDDGVLVRPAAEVGAKSRQVTACVAKIRCHGRRVLDLRLVELVLDVRVVRRPQRADRVGCRIGRRERALVEKDELLLDPERRRSGHALTVGRFRPVGGGNARPPTQRYARSRQTVNPVGATAPSG